MMRTALQRQLSVPQCQLLHSRCTKIAQDKKQSCCHETEHQSKPRIKRADVGSALVNSRKSVSLRMVTGIIRRDVLWSRNKCCLSASTGKAG